MTDDQAGEAIHMLALIFDELKATNRKLDHLAVLTHQGNNR